MSGEAGIGKSRLAEEAGARAAARGFRPLWGRSWESEGAPAFWPWVQILRSAVRDIDGESLASYPAEALSHVAELVPQIRERVPGIASAPLVSGAEEARFTRFDALAAFLSRAAEERPLFIVLDDLHWADRPSILLLEFLAQSLATLPVLAVAAYRAPDAGDTPLDGELAGRLLRMGRNLPLVGLSESDVGRFVAESGRAKPLESFISAVHSATAGNPFFVVEVLRLFAAEPPTTQLVRALAESFPIPQSVRAAVRRRIALLPDDTRRILVAAAVVGREFEVPILARAYGLGSSGVLDALAHATAAGVLLPGPRAPLKFAFSHGLVKETLYDDLAPAARADLHQRVAEAIESLFAGRLDLRLSELAYHYGEVAASGGGMAEAIDYSRRAGERAERLLAYEEAIKHFERTLALFDASGQADDRKRCDTLMSLARSLWDAGAFERSIAVYSEAGALAETLGDAETFALAAIGPTQDYASDRRQWTDFDRIRVIEKALAILPPQDSALRTRLTARLARDLTFTSPIDRADALRRKSIAMARRVGDPTALFEALLYCAPFDGRDFEPWLAIGNELLGLAQMLGGNRRLFFARLIRRHALLIAGDRAAADLELRLLEEAGASIPETRGYFQILRGGMAVLEGRFEDAERMRDEAAAAQGPYFQFFDNFLRFVLRREQGRLGETLAHIESVATDNPGSPVWPIMAASILAETGRAVDARRLVDRLWEALLGDGPAAEHVVDTLWPLAELVVAIADRDRAAIVYDALRSAGHLCETGPDAIVCFDTIAHALGNLALLLGRFDEAEGHFETALEICAKMRARPWAARTEHDFARMLVARGAPGDRKKALVLVDCALATAREIGMAGLEEHASTLRAELGGGAPIREAEFCAIDGGWRVRYQAPSFQLRDRKGLRYIVHLLRHRDDELHVADLVAAVETRSDDGAPDRGDAGELLDSRARAEYRERLRDLEHDLEEAKAHGDLGRIERLRSDIDFVQSELSAAYGLGGGARRGADVAERMRKAVTNRIRDAIEEIERHDSDLAGHLSSAIRTGKFCAYEPREGIRWSL